MNTLLEPVNRIVEKLCFRTLVAQNFIALEDLFLLTGRAETRFVKGNRCLTVIFRRFNNPKVKVDLRNLSRSKLDAFNFLNHLKRMRVVVSGLAVIVQFHAAVGQRTQGIHQQHRFVKHYLA